LYNFLNFLCAFKPPLGNLNLIPSDAVSVFKYDANGLIKEARTRIEKVSPQAVEGGRILVTEFMKGSFVSGLKDERIKVYS
jgi:hypothetical protein